MTIAKIGANKMMGPITCMSAGGIEMAVGVVAKAELFTWRRPVAEFNSSGMATADELTPGADGSATAASWTVRTSVARAVHV